MKNIFKDQVDHLLLLLFPFIAHPQNIASEEIFFPDIIFTRDINFNIFQWNVLKLGLTTCN